MKITDLNQRVQGFRLLHNVADDGEATIIYKPSKWYWAKISPKSYIENPQQNQPYVCRYEIVMRKSDTCNTRHACIRRVIWKYKILDIYTPWLEMKENQYVYGLAQQKEKQHG